MDSAIHVPGDLTDAVAARSPSPPLCGAVEARARRKRIVVGFAGGGGSSLAIAAALGVHPDVAINHWAPAIRHSANFPDCAHYLSDIFEVDPREVLPGEEIGLAWFSPDCRHHSKAKGGAPVSKRVRGLAWVVIQWAKLRAPDVIFMENVEEWLDWGPLVVREDGRTVPDPARKGQTATLFFKRLRQCGYRVEHRVSSAADYGDPTIRKRMLVIARRDGRPIVWPAPTHTRREALAKAQAIRDATLPPLKSHVAAASFIDFTRPCPSIFLTREEAKAVGCKRPLEAATMRRIARGTQRFTIAKADPYIVPLKTWGGGGNDGRSVGEPARTVTASKRGEFALISPSLHSAHPGECRDPGFFDHEPHEPHERDFVRPPPVGRAGSESPAVADGSAGHVREVREVRGQFVSPVIVPHFGERAGQEPRSRDGADPYPTAVPGGRTGDLAAVFVEQANTDMVGHDARDPLSTIVGKGCTQRVVAAQLTQFRSSNADGGQADPDEPLTGLVAGGRHHGLIAAALDTYYSGGSVGGDAGDPLRTSTAKARHSLIVAQLSAVEDHGRRRQVLAFLRAHFGEPTAADLADPLGTVEARTRFGIVMLPERDFVGGVAFIVDIGMRMLDPETELARAMSWPATYVLGVDATGQRVTKTTITKLVGNGVCVEWAKAHIAANCNDLPWWGEREERAAA